MSFDIHKMTGYKQGNKNFTNTIFHTYYCHYFNVLNFYLQLVHLI